MNQMITAQQAADKWGVTLRRVQDYCKQGRIPGAARFGSNWMIPEDAVRPVDRRRKAEIIRVEKPQPLIRKSSFLDMTDLYSEPGTADAVIDSLSEYPEAQVLFAAEIAYSRGEIGKAAEQAQRILQNHTGMYATIAGGMLLALAAMWSGDIGLWNTARKSIYGAPCADEEDRDIILLSVAATDSAIRNTRDFPEWFRRGCFDHLPRDAHPAARVYYIKYLLIYAQELNLGNVKLEGISGFGLLRILPHIVEPMISQMVVDKVLMAEIYLRLLISIAYHQCGDDNYASAHLDKAIKLCLADNLYGPLCEHRRQLGTFLDDRLAMIDPDALKQVKRLHKQLHEGWTKIHNAVLNAQVQVTLAEREREIARLAAYGMTDAQISSQLHISLSSVKSAIRSVKNKTGAATRSELAFFV